MNPLPILRASSLLWHSFVILISAFASLRSLLRSSARFAVLAVSLCSAFISASAAVPQLINHQGRIAVNGTNFEGTGQFKFALVNSTGAITYWSNNGTSTAGSQPTAAVSLPVVKGLYAVLLGDAGMTALPASVFENADVRLRVWFNDGVLGFQQITPDQRLAAAPFALNAAKAESVPDGSITGAKLASGLTLGGTTSGTFSGNLTGNASTATSATNFSGSLAGDVTGTQSATAIAASTVTGKVITGFVSGAGSLTATDTILTALNKLDGNAALKAPIASPSFTGTVSGSFSGNGSALTGLNGANIATGTVGSTQISDLSIVNADVSPSAAIADSKLATLITAGKVANSATTATSANTASSIVLRDANGNFNAATITATLNGNASTATSAGSFTGSLSGDVTGTQGATVVAATIVTSKALTGFSSATGAITASDTILTAINKLDGNLALRAPLVSPTFTGTVSGSFSGNGSALTQLSGGSLTAGSVALAALAGDSVDSSKIVNSTIINADVSSSAAIDYSKLNLAGAIVNADINATAAIADTKLATISSPGKVANSATTATTSNTPSTLVLRDGSGNFSAGTITGTFVGDGSGLTGLTGVNASQILLQDVLAPPIRPVVAWGDNDNGQTSVPTTLINANTAAIAAGGSVAVALLKTGTVVQWGSGTAVPSGLTNVTHIAAGAAHRLARKSDGTVTAWGDNTYGQSTVPGGLTTATNVAAGEKHSLALRADGTVLAWGDNTFGQTTVPGSATNVIAIACGYDHSLALKADGSVIAWGRDDSGQSTVPGSLTNVVAIAAGAFHSLAVRADGTVVAWGWNGGGQVAGAAALTGVSKVAGGYAFSLALKNDGTLVAFGDNTDGQLNLGAEAVNVTAIAAGPSHALALRADLIPAQIARLDQDNVFTGKVGIRRAPAANTLEVEGQASKTTAGNWLANSDRRIKDKVKPITGALEKLSKVRLVDFNYTPDYLAAHPGIEDKRYLNVIAQEFAEVFPEDVKSSGETLPDGSPILQVDTYPLTIYSAAAVQELAKENEKLKKQLADQETRLKKLEEAIK